MKYRMSLALIMVLLATVVQAVEVDDISNFYTPPKESSGTLNSHVNQLLREAAKATANCSIPQFEQQVLERLTPKGVVNRTFFGGVELFAQSSPEIDRAKVSLDESIYRGSPFERATLVIAGELFKIGSIFPSLQLNGHMVGTDKLSHFFETGYELYRENLRKSASLSDLDFENLISSSIALEEEHLGWEVTGIKSYGDITAHMQGALFWKQLLSSGGEWWSCDSGKMTLTKAFDFKDFVHDGWSEAINCNEYKEKKGSSIFDVFRGPPPPYLATIQANATELERKSGLRYRCPIEPDGCVRAKEFIENLGPIFRAHVNELISPACR